MPSGASGVELEGVVDDLHLAGMRELSCVELTSLNHSGYSVSRMAQRPLAARRGAAPGQGQKSGSLQRLSGMG